MNDRSMFKRFCEVVLQSEEKEYGLVLTPVQVTTLHGAVALAMKHPEIQQQETTTMPILRNIRNRLLSCMKEMGFTEEEIHYLDTKEAE